MENRSRQPWQQPEIIQLSELILASYRHWLQSELIPPATTPELTAKNLFEAPFVVLAHNTDADPIYTYGNRSALELWERDWEELVQMPSRQSAESSQQAQLVRNQLLADSRSYGYTEGFSGVRVSKSGKRICIEDVILWDLLDSAAQYQGQAAVFSKWTFLD